MNQPAVPQGREHEESAPRGIRLSQGELITLAVAFCMIALVAVPSFMNALYDIRGRECSNRLGLIYKILTDIAQARGTQPGEEICQVFDINLRLDRMKAFIKIGAEPDCPDVGDYIVDLHLGMDGRPIPPMCALGSWLFCMNDLRDPRALAVSLRDASDELSVHLRTLFSEDLVKSIDNYTELGPPPVDLQRNLVDELNQIVRKENLYLEERFAQVKLSENVRQEIGKPLEGEDMTRFNRWLLEEAYPGRFEKRNIKPGSEHLHRFVPPAIVPSG